MATKMDQGPDTLLGADVSLDWVPREIKVSSDPHYRAKKGGTNPANRLLYAVPPLATRNLLFAHF